MTAQNDPDSFCQHLRATGAVRNEDLERALAVSRSEAQRIERSLLALGLIEEIRLLQILTDWLSLALTLDGEGYSPAEDAVAHLGSAYLTRNAILPVLNRDNTFCLLTADPRNDALRNEVAFLLERSFTLVGAPQRVIRDCIVKSAGDPRPDNRLSPEQAEKDIGRFKETTADGPAIKFVAAILSEAVDQGASDVHFETTQRGLRIRFRQHGILREQPLDSSLNASAVVARLKVMASMNVTERRLPQDGRISLTVSGRPIDFRVSSIPTQHGQGIVCRVLDPDALKRGWPELGFAPQTQSWILEILERPSGLFLVTGPTGSGKTTTLYAALTHLNTTARKIITVEDPVEYDIDGIEQIQVHEAIGLTFAAALRAILRQDPNVIMIGEIRDEETAAMACRAAMVGRLVLSTLHTSSAEGAIPRLQDLGVPKYLIDDTLIGVLSQDLVADCDERGQPAGRRLVAKPLRFR